MIRIHNINISVPFCESRLADYVARLLKINSSEIKNIEIVRKSVDARHKNDVKLVYTVDVNASCEKKILKSGNCKITVTPCGIDYIIKPAESDIRPVIAGFGPAGMFAALVLARSGLRPLVVERGSDVDARVLKVEELRKSGVLDTECNVQFGEGGAGTFSDGKLNTGINNSRIDFVLREFYLHGALKNILYDAKPHIGTDYLIRIVRNIREEIISLGGEIRFNTKLSGLKTRSGKICGAVCVCGGKEYEISTDTIVLATGHSARDTFEMLKSTGVPMQKKAFSMGVRIEHLQSDIDRAQYGNCAGMEGLGAADYKLSCHLEKASVYTFCMCPGGEVIASASEEGGVVTNGMSLSSRNGVNANAAVLVSVLPENFPGDDVLSGVYMQREVERKAYEVGNYGYMAVVQKLGDFMKGRPSVGPGKVVPSYKPGVVYGNICDVLPSEITDAIKEAIPVFDRKIHGFAYSDAILTAPETRSSSPVRVLRDENGMSSVTGLYPCGEGAGYAGGITSSCVDGMKTAENIIEYYLQKNAADI